MVKSCRGRTSFLSREICTERGREGGRKTEGWEKPGRLLVSESLQAVLAILM